MAAYGRGGSREGGKVGGKGGLTASQAYDFGTKDAQSYLTGAERSKYERLIGRVTGDLYSGGLSSKEASKLVRGQLYQKHKFKKDLGGLRETAEGRAIGKMMNWAPTTSRGYLAHGKLISDEEQLSQGDLSGSTAAGFLTSTKGSRAGRIKMGLGGGTGKVSYGTAEEAEAAYDALSSYKNVRKDVSVNDVLSGSVSSASNWLARDKLSKASPYARSLGAVSAIADRYA